MLKVICEVVKIDNHYAHFSFEFESPEYTERSHVGIDLQRVSWSHSFIEQLTIMSNSIFDIYFLAAEEERLSVTTTQLSVATF